VVRRKAARQVPRHHHPLQRRRERQRHGRRPEMTIKRRLDSAR
jgi:hypothetical protein